ncbi:MAG: bifunctional hydroxymethylpyrimidine kinase/phosphomethylpyrimidine kinase [Caulobacteraceae bacterium]
MADPRGRVLILAGSDSGGGAGIQGDIKTVTALGGYAATAITAITVQNTLGVQRVDLVAADLIEDQARAVLDDIGADAIKIGMLGAVPGLEVAARILDRAGAIPAVIDPVMVAKGGARLLDPDALSAFVALMIPRAFLLTPNAPEAGALTGLPATSTDDLRRAGERLLAMGAGAVLLKGGHIRGDTVTDLLMTPRGEATFRGPRLATSHTHGTGCALASACAVGLAQGLDLQVAVARAWGYTAEAIRRAPGFGAGNGPIDHAWPLRPD